MLNLTTGLKPEKQPARSARHFKGAVFMIRTSICSLLMITAAAVPAHAMKIVQTEEQREAAKCDPAVDARLSSIMERTSTVLVAEYLGKYEQPDANDFAFLFSFKNLETIKGQQDTAPIKLVLTQDTIDLFGPNSNATVYDKLPLIFTAGKKYLILATPNSSKPSHYFPLLIVPKE